MPQRFLGKVGEINDLKVKINLLTNCGWCNYWYYPLGGFARLWFLSLTPLSHHFDVVVYFGTQLCWIELTMREIVGPLLNHPLTLQKLTLNALSVAGAPPSWPMCKYHALLYSSNHFFLARHVNLNRATKLALPSGRLFRVSTVWTAVECRYHIQNVTKCSFFSRINLDTTGLLNCSVRAWMSISTRYVTFHDLS